MQRGTHLSRTRLLLAVASVAACIAAITPVAFGGSAPVNTAPPTVSGTAKVGSKLTADPGTWSGSPTGFAYQWQRCESTGSTPAGESWALQNATVNNPILSIVWGGPAGAETFVATVEDIDGSNSILTSPDGVTWTKRTAPRDTYVSVAWGGPAGDRKFVAVNPLYVATSPDGITWTEQAAPSTHFWTAVTWGGPTGDEKFVAVSRQDQVVMTSPDGITWTEHAAAADGFWGAVAWGGPPGQEKFVAIDTKEFGAATEVMTSPDGVAWTAQTAPDGRWKSVTWGGPAGGEKFVAVGIAALMTSPDGITWTAQPAAGTRDWRGVTWGGEAGDKKFVVVSRNSTEPVEGGVITSPDGVTWTDRTSAAQNYWVAVAWGGAQGQETFVAVAAGGTGPDVNVFSRVMTGAAPSLTCTDISGATAETYTLTSADAGKVLRVKVTATNGSGSASATSRPTAIVAAGSSGGITVGAPQVRGSTIRTLVRVRGAGRVTQAGTFRSGSRAKVACRATPVSAKKAGTVLLRCAITQGAQSARTAGPVRVKLATTFRPTGGKARVVTRTVVLRSLKPAPAFTG
ncbi:unannotated protein [freshwater metagenome]|uniref:Unannotated protein n=1 Tax=freshwater metagenome TaxID=449393 RepID=A0A6J7CRD5_9ZZZZ|nr:hypothetical protein [Actinomycetota bacterium]